jgi:uroporphyrinogen-III synthase
LARLAQVVTIEVMLFTSPIETRPLYGHRVLVPRGGPWGDEVASALRSKGATAVIAPMINFAVTDDQPALEAALAELAAGAFDWVTLTSATTVDVLMAHRTLIPASTKVAAVGETTAAALAAAGYKADLVPSEDNTARGLLEQWTAVTGGVIPLKVLTLRSQDAIPVLTPGLERIGHDVRSVVAYQTVGVPVADGVVEDVKNAKFDVILVTSGSVARQVAEQFGEIPAQTTVVAVGPRTAKDAKALGLRIDVVAETPEPKFLVELLMNQVYG